MKGIAKLLITLAVGALLIPVLAGCTDGAGSGGTMPTGNAPNGPGGNGPGGPMGNSPAGNGPR